MSNLDTVIQHTAEEDTLIDSAVDMINGLKAQIVSLKTPTTDAATASKIDALDADITAKKAQLVAALVVNTPIVVPTATGTPVTTITPAEAAAAATAAIAANPPVIVPANTVPLTMAKAIAEWNVTQAYTIGDKVTFQGATYTAAMNSTGVQPLAATSAQWTRT